MTEQNGMHPQDAKLEADIAITYAKLRSVVPAARAKEPYDAPDEMVSVAYAMFRLLAEVGTATGREREWDDFLRGALDECIYMERNRRD